MPQKTLYARSTRGGSVLPVDDRSRHDLGELLDRLGALRRRRLGSDAVRSRRGRSAAVASAGSGDGATSGDVRRGFGFAAGLGCGTATGAGGGGSSVIVAVSGTDSGETGASAGQSVSDRCRRSDSTSATASARRVRDIAFDCARRSEIERSVGAAASGGHGRQQCAASGFVEVPNVDSAAVDDKPPFAIPAYDPRQQHVFRTEHARRERILVVAVQHRDRGLRDDRADVDVRRHEMHGAAVDAHAVGERAAMRVEARVGRQQRRVDVDHAARVARDERRAQHAHEAREHDEIGPVAVDRGRERGVEVVAARERAMVDDRSSRRRATRRSRVRRRRRDW